MMIAAINTSNLTDKEKLELEIRRLRKENKQLKRSLRSAYRIINDLEFSVEELYLEYLDAFYD